MTGFLDACFGDSGGIDTGDIGHSLRWRRSASAYIATGVTTAATSTYFAFFKQGALDAVNPIFDGNIKINANNTITAFGLTTTAVKRDPTSWHWIHVSNNGLVFDGVNLGAVTTSAITNLRIGYDGTNYADMYGTRICCVSGSSLAYTDFVYFNSDFNEWVVKSQSTIKALVDAGGSASFMYDFDNGASTTTLGYDKSSKGNNATLNNFSLTAGATYDWMTDIPGNNFPVLNPLIAGMGSTIVNAGVSCSGVTSSNAGYVNASMDFSTPGKWYFEVAPSSITGIFEVYLGASTIIGYRSDGTKDVEGANSAYGASYTTTDLIGCALDSANKTVEFFKNNTSQGQFSYTNSGSLFPGVIVRGVGSLAAHINFGQRPFSYTPPTGFKALCQANIETPAILNPEQHHNVYTVTKSGDTNFTLDWDASVYDTYFEIKRRNASGDWYNIDGLRGYDKVLKSNSTAAETTDANVLGVSGTTCTLKSTLADGTYVIRAWKAGKASERAWNFDGTLARTATMTIADPCVVTLNSHGFAAGQAVKFTTTGALPTGVTASTTYYAGNIATNTFNLYDTEANAIAGGATGRVATSGSQSGTNTCEHASKVSVNVEAGQSITTYVGIGANATIGHGLGKAAKKVVAKDRTNGARTASQWPVYHYGSGATKALYLHDTLYAYTDSTAWQNTAPTSAVFSVGTWGGVNYSGDSFVAYVHAEIPGYSKFGSFTVQDAYVDLGLKAKTFDLKRTDSTSDWFAWDTVRAPYNPISAEVYPNGNYAEGSANVRIDIDALGIKVRATSGVNPNVSGATYIYSAYADVAGKFSLAR